MVRYYKNISKYIPSHFVILFLVLYTEEREIGGGMDICMYQNNSKMFIQFGLYFHNLAQVSSNGKAAVGFFTSGIFMAKSKRSSSLELFLYMVDSQKT